MPGIASPWLGAAPVGDQHMLGAHRLAGVETRSVLASTNSARLLTIVTPALFEDRVVDAFEAGDLLVLVGDQRRPVERRLGDRPAIARGVRDLVVDMGGIDQELLGHAAADHAGAAHAVLFGDHHLGAMVARDAGGAYAASSRRR